MYPVLNIFLEESSEPIVPAFKEHCKQLSGIFLNCTALLRELPSQPLPTGTVLPSFALNFSSEYETQTI